MKILMVCLGNICRSPLADGILKNKVSQLKLDVQVDSAGTSNNHIGQAPDHRMQKTALAKGYDLSGLKARQFVVDDFDVYDLIFVMDKSNRDNVLKLARTHKDKEKVLLLLNESHPGKDLEVPDPYYGGAKGFEDVYQLVNDATEAIINKRLSQ